jgi:hypothetical protein
MLDWLVKRLSPAQKESERYVELAESLQQYWEDNFDPEFDKLQRLRSIYTASPDDLARKIAELGERFTPDNPTEYDQPLALAWRLSEIERKETAFVLINAFRRNFGNLDTQWIALWAPKGSEYGETFRLETDLKDWQKELLYFQTSRGKLRSDLGQIHAIGMTKADFLTAAEKIIGKTKPAHIVYDGPIFYLVLPIDMPVLEVAFPTEPVKRFPMHAMCYRYDDVAADERYADSGNMAYRYEVERNLAFIWEVPTERLDMFPLLDDVPADFAPLDTPIGGEGAIYE